MNLASMTYSLYDLYTTESISDWNHTTTEHHYSNHTTTPHYTGPTPIHPGWNIVPVFGYPGYQFWLVHISALVVLCCSEVASISVLIYLNYPFKRNFFTRSIGERLVVYLGFCDAMFAFSHTLDHAYMITHRKFPPNWLCRGFAFFIVEFILAQSIIVSFTALNALLMVVFTIKIPLGRYDWKLNLLAFGFPFILCVTAEGFELLGPSGPWCIVDTRNPNGPAIQNTISVTLLFVFVTNLGCYVFILLKMRSVEKKLSKNKGGDAGGGKAAKYHGTAKIMMLFVLVYITQYWAIACQGMWSIFREESLIFNWPTVIFTNLGGVLNVMAYTVVRKKQNAAAVKPTDNKTTMVPASAIA